jgi:AraC-like DNA-binding protein
MMKRFRVASAIARKLDDLGLSPSTILRQAGLPANLFNQDKVLVTTEEFFAFYRSLAELSHDPAIGLKLGTEDRIERYDPIAIAALCTRSFRDALQRMARYKQLTCPEVIEMVEQGNECAVHFQWLLATEEEPPMLVDVCFAWIMAIARRGSGRPISPLRVEFLRSASNRELYESHFGCPVRFNAERNVLVFTKADLDGPFLTYNADLLAMVAPQLEAELSEQLAEANLGERVKGVLKRQLAGQRPAIHDVGRELHMSTRTLQRRLTEEGLTFKKLVREARHELARHYLLHSSRELNETAYLLGYEDANSFFRAFQTWEGTTPGQWRAAHMTAYPSPSIAEPAQSSV